MAGVTFMPLALGRNVMRNLHASPPVLSNVGVFSRRCSFKDFSIPWASSYRTYSSHNGRNCIIQSQVGSIQMIAINRPHKRNAVDPETAKYLHEAIQDFEADENTSAAVLYGKDGVFCAGFDLSALASGGYQESLVSTADDVQGPMGPTRFLCSKPVIAAIEGYAVAGGLELALWCDLRVMDETAILGVFCRRFGVPLVDGGTVRLPKLIGLSRALDLILTGREVRAKEALEIGLVNRVCDTGSAVGRALLLAQEISKFPSECMRADRMSAYYSSFDASSIQDAIRYEYENGLKVIEKESIPGAKNFVSGIGRHGSFNLHKTHTKS